MDHLPNGYDGSGGEIQQREVVYSHGSLARRQTQILAIPTTYNGLNSGPPPGTVVGIVLGSVVGFLLIIWLIYTCTFPGGNTFSFPWGRRGDIIVEEEVIRRRSRRSRHSRSSEEHSPVRLNIRHVEADGKIGGVSKPNETMVNQSISC
jgi:hypothetical protein